MGYPKQVYERAWGILDARVSRGRAEAEQRKQDILRELPEIGRIERDMAYLAAQSIYAAAGKGDVKARIEALAKENLALQERRAALLTAAGYPADYLRERYECGLCHDKGYIGTEMCSCFQELLRGQAFSMISDYPGSGNATFEGFDLSFYPKEPEPSGVIPRRRMADIREYCRQYARDFSGASPSLLMMGKTGLGKTHLSLAIAAKVVERGFGVVYTPVQKLCDRLENGKFSYQQESKDRYAQDLASVLECDLLVLDDLGTEFISSFTSSAIGNIINSRLLDERPTICSTNLDLPALEKQYSQRMASRLGFSYKVLAFTGEDIRYLMRTKGRKLC